MKQTILTLLIIFAVLRSINAQIAETSWLYLLENTSKRSIQNQKTTITLKLVNLKGYEDTEQFFARTLKEKIEKGQLIIYKDVNCTQPVLQENVNEYLTVSVKDTIQTFDPETFQEHLQIANSQIDYFPHEETIFRLHQKWFFDKRKQQLSSTIDRITIENRLGEEKERYFTIKLNTDKKQPTSAFLMKNSIHFAKRIMYVGDFKGQNIHQSILNQKHYNQNKLMNLLGEVAYEEDIDFLLNGGIDTIVIFDPETFNEELKIIKTPPLEIEKVEKYRVVQDFYFDPAQMRMHVRILGIAPTSEVYDENQNFMFDGSIFWIVYDEDMFND